MRILGNAKALNKKSKTLILNTNLFYVDPEHLTYFIEFHPEVIKLEFD